MEKKVKFTDNPNFAKTVYGVIIAVLCITAIIIGIVAANQRQGGDVPGDTPVLDGGENVTPPDDENNGDTTPPEGGTGGEEVKKLEFISPVSGKVVKNHSTTIPVFSETLEEWRIHKGIDISTAEGAPVFSAAEGEITRIFNDPLLGASIEITHDDNYKTVYSNLVSGEELVRVGEKVEAGARIGTVGDSSISELAEEPHLHFAIIENGNSVDPLTVISDAAKEASLGISTEVV